MSTGRTESADADESVRSAHPDGGWIRRLRPFLAPHRRSLVIALSGGVLGQVALTAIPLIQRTALDDAIVAGRRPLWPLLAAMVALAAVAFGATVMRRFAGNSFGLSVQRDLSSALHRHLTHLDLTVHGRTSRADLLSRTTADIVLVQTVLSQLHVIVGNLTTLLVVAMAMIWLSVPLSAVILLLVPATAILSARLRRRLFAASWEVQRSVADLTATVTRTTSGAHVVRAFGQEERERVTAGVAAADLATARGRAAAVRARYLPAIEQVPVVGQAVVLSVGGWMAVHGTLTVGTLVAFSAYLVQLTSPARTLSGALTAFQSARVGALRVLELLDARSEIREAPGAEPVGAGDGELIVTGVGFAHPNRPPVFTDLELTVAAGERIAICGPTGSGKSTLGFLVARLHDVTAGSITIDGVDVRDLSFDSLRRTVSIAFEDPMLLSGTIADNIAHGRPDASRDEIVDAGRIAMAHDFIERMPQGYDTVITEGGRSLSGGQRQRIALARTLLERPRIMVLDDATSALDTITERAILTEVDRAVGGCTMLLLARRPATLAIADRVVFLSHGRIIADGPHETLLRTEPRYRAFVEGTADEERPPADPLADDPAPAEALNGSGARSAAVLTPSRLAVRETASTRVDDRTDAEHEPRSATIPLRLQAPPWNTPIRLRPLLRRHRGALLLCLVLLVIDALASLVVPLILGRGIDRGVTSERLTIVTLAATSIIAVAGFAWVNGRALIRRVASVSEDLLFDLRTLAFDRLLRLPIARTDRERSGSLTARLTGDVDAFAQLLDVGLLAAITSAVSAVGVAIALIVLDLRLAIAALAVVPVAILATEVYRRSARHAHDRARRRVSSVYAVAQEGLATIALTKANRREEEMTNRFDHAAEEVRIARLRTARLAAVYFPLLNVTQLIAKIAILGAAAGTVGSDGAGAGAVAAALLLADQLFTPLQQLSQVFDQALQAGSGWRRLRELDGWAEPEPTGDCDLPVPNRIDRIALREVEFRFGNGERNALGPVSTDFERGQQIAVVGATGSGKTTLARILLRFHEPVGGTITVDGRILDARLGRSLRGSIGYVPQEPWLFAGTVADNIAYGRPTASLSEIRAAADSVGVHSTLIRLPDGYDTRIDDAGRGLAAGERQLVCLARAILIDPAVLLLDEATSDLDPATHRRIARALRTVRHDRITITIAHRLDTASNADRVLVLDDGLIVEDGPPEQLLRTDGHLTALFAPHHPRSLICTSGGR